MMSGRSPATQPSAPSPPSLRPSLARSSGDVGLPVSAALVLTALPAVPGGCRQSRDAPSSRPEPGHTSPPLPGPRSPPAPARPTPRAPITRRSQNADASAEAGPAGGARGRPRVDLHTCTRFLNKVVAVVGEQQGGDPRQAPGREHAGANARAALGWAIPTKASFEEAPRFAMEASATPRYLAGVRPRAAEILRFARRSPSVRFLRKPP